MYESSEQTIVNLDCYPKVIVNLYSVKDIMILTQEWFKLYEYNTPFTFIFNLNNLNAKIKDIGYGVLLSNFIKKIKKHRKINPGKYNLLKESIIVVENKLNYSFIKSVFNLTTPLSNTYIVNTLEKANILYDNILKNDKIDLNNIKLIKP